MTTESRIIEWGPYPSGVAVVQVTTAPQHVNITGTPLQAAINVGKPLMLSADHACVLYSWTPTSTSQTIGAGLTGLGSGMNGATLMGAMVFGAQRTPVPESAPRDSLGLVVAAPSGPSVLRIWWGW